MNNFSALSSETDTYSEQVAARTAYFGLRDKLVALQSAPDPDQSAIDLVIRELEEAQLAYKATHGLIGNNPIED